MASAMPKGGRVYCLLPEDGISNLKSRSVPASTQQCVKVARQERSSCRHRRSFGRARFQRPVLDRGFAGTRLFSLKPVADFVDITAVEFSDALLPDVQSFDCGRNLWAELASDWIKQAPPYRCAISSMKK